MRALLSSFGRTLIVSAAIVVAGLCSGLVARSSAGGPVARANGDVNGDGAIDIADALYTLNWLFQGGAAPAAIADSPELTGRVGSLEQRVFELERINREANHIRDSWLDGLNFRVSKLEGLTQPLSIEDLDDGQGGKLKTLRISGANLQIVNGLGTTFGPPGTPWGEAVVNGLGNLIIGYAEPRTPDMEEPDVRTGSHNLIIGPYQNYSSLGGAVIGRRSTISGPFCSVLGGSHNVAGGFASSVLGGNENQATGSVSTLSGGKGNLAQATFSWLAGGCHLYSDACAE